MTPGRFHAETGATIGIKPGETRVLDLRDTDGVKASSWFLPTQDTSFSIEVSDIELPDLRPTRLIVDIVRKDGNRTNRCSRGVPVGGSNHWADVFGTGWEYVNPDEGLFYFTIEHDGPNTVRIGKIVVDAINPRASEIHALGGYNRWSDGNVR
jgi:hypothetical protein